MTIVDTEEMMKLLPEGVNRFCIIQSQFLRPKQKSHGKMIFLLAPRRTTCLGASFWGSMVVAVNIYLAIVNVLPAVLGDSCLLGQK